MRRRVHLCAVCRLSDVTNCCDRVYNHQRHGPFSPRHSSVRQSRAVLVGYAEYYSGANQKYLAAVGDILRPLLPFSAKSGAQLPGIVRAISALLHRFVLSG